MTANGVQTGDRDLRLDLFRGLANWAIFVDHVPNNAVAWITARNYGFSDAAELFVFVSGYTVAFVYARTARAKGFLAAALGILGRAWQLYVAYILLFVFYVVTIGYVAQRYGHAHLLDEFNITRLRKSPSIALRLLIRDPVEFLKHGLLLEYKPLNLDVLPLYIALMFAFPPLLWVLMRWPNVALAISAGIYVAAQAWGWNLRAYPAGHWYFNPFAWQFLFVIGAWVAVGGATTARGLIYARTTLAAACLFLLFAAIVTLAARTGHAEMIVEPVRSLFIPNNKTHLAPYRVVHFLALAIVVSRLIPKEAPFLSAPWLRPLRLWRAIARSLLRGRIPRLRRLLRHRPRLRFARLPDRRQCRRHRHHDRLRLFQDMDQGVSRHNRPKGRRARRDSTATTSAKGAMRWVSTNTTNRRRSFRRRSAPSRG